MRIIAGLLLCTISTGALAQAVTQPAGTFLATPAANAGYLGTRLISPSDLTQWYGAACDGSTDDTAALNAALSSAKGVEVVLPQGKSCESFTGITVPSGARLVGQAFNSEDPTLFTGGSRIQCPQNIPNPCVTIGSGNTGANSASMQGVIVQGIGSATMTQGIGVKVDGVTGATLRDIMVYNFYDGYDLKSYNQAGTGAVMENVHTGVIADAHILIDSWPETLDRTHSGQGLEAEINGVVPGWQHRLVGPLFWRQPVHAARVSNGRDRRQGGAGRSPQRLPARHLGRGLWLGRHRGRHW